MNTYHCSEMYFFLFFFASYRNVAHSMLNQCNLWLALCTNIRRGIFRVLTYNHQKCWATAQFVERLWDFPLSQFVTYEATWDVDVFCRGIIQIRTHFSSPTKAAKVPGGSENTKQKQNLLFISTSQEAIESCWFISSFKHGLGISTWRSNFVLFRQLRGFSLKYFCSHYEKVNNQELLW